VTAPALVVQTPAKINWVLEVLRRREDGYHELALVFQAVDLWDELSFWKSPEGVEFSIPESPVPLAADDSNLVLKAARLFFKETGIKEGARIELKKRIPLAAGLGGGSSDAAATLLGLDWLCETKLSEETLHRLAAQLGSDVPFFLKGGTALGKGRGELLQSWAPAPALSLVLVNPGAGLSTPQVFQSGKAHWSDGRRAEEFQKVLEKGPASAIAKGLFNGLEPAAFHLMPAVETLKNSLLQAGALGALVSGSGPTVFGLAEDRAQARKIADRLGAKGDTIFEVQTISGGPRRTA
jgi:4-diphosphocytidyl-2-C-methyl-D-erythritol kinase